MVAVLSQHPHVALGVGTELDDGVDLLAHPLVGQSEDGGVDRISVGLSEFLRR